MFNEDKLNMPIAVPLLVQTINDKPALELRRKITSTDIIKVLITCAFQKQPVVIVPMFTDELQSLSSLLEKGIIYFDKDKNTYSFTI